VPKEFILDPANELELDFGWSVNWTKKLPGIGKKYTVEQKHYIMMYKLKIS
jgi:hypothetical protein